VLTRAVASIKGVRRQQRLELDRVNHELLQKFRCDEKKQAKLVKQWQASSSRDERSQSVRDLRSPRCVLDGIGGSRRYRSMIEAAILTSSSGRMRLVDDLSFAAS
jgi:hypothetical protein